MPFNYLTQRITRMDDFSQNTPQYHRNKMARRESCKPNKSRNNRSEGRRNLGTTYKNLI